MKKTILLLLLLTLNLTGCISNTEVRNNQGAQPTVARVLLPYKVKQQDDISLASRTRMVYRIEVQTEKIPTEEQLRDIALTNWTDGNQHWDEFTTFIYLPGMKITQSAYGIGNFTPSGLTDFHINKPALIGTKWRSWDVIEAEAKAQEEKVKSDKLKNSQAKSYQINLNTKPLQDHKLQIDVDTNFPDDTNLLISVSRLYRIKGSTSESVGTIFEKDLPVKNGHVSIIADVDDSEWHNEQVQRTRLFPNEFPSISKISPVIDVDVLYSPARDQPEVVKKVLGENGENVKGIGIEIALEMTILRKSEKVDIPFK